MAQGRTTRRSGRRSNSRKGFLLLFVVVACFVVVISLRIQAISVVNRRYEAEYEANRQILAQEERHLSELQDRQSRAQTDEDIEKVAREQLGLIKPGEILLKPNP